MTTLIDILITALGVAFFIGLIDAFIELRKSKGFVGLPFAVGILYLMGYWTLDFLVLAPASTFVALAIISLLDRPAIIQPTRRF
jgi:hypothetical protein